MQGLDLPSFDYLLNPIPLATTTGEPTWFSLGSRSGKVPNDLLWELIGPQPSCEFNPKPADATTSIHARFHNAGVHLLRAVNHNDQSTCLARHDYPVFEPIYGNLLGPLLSLGWEEARRYYERLHESRRGEGERRKLVSDLEHLLKLPGVGRIVCALLLHHTPHIKEFLKSRARRFDRKLVDFEDLYQELYLKLDPKLHSYKPEGKFHAYAARALDNLYIDRYRRNGQNQVFSPVGDDEAAVRQDLDAFFDREELVSQMFSDLDAEEFKLFTAFHFFGRHYPEIADMMGVPSYLPKYTRITRASRKIHSILIKLRGSDDALPSGMEG